MTSTEQPKGKSRTTGRTLKKGIFVTCAAAFAYNLAYNAVTVDENGRSLSVSLGGGACKWQPPNYVVPNDIEFTKTIVAGFPSGDKRLTFIQMEALTGWPAKDEWDFEFLGMSNHPFIKANYPHHEGTFSRYYCSILYFGQKYLFTFSGKMNLTSK